MSYVRIIGQGKKTVKFFVSPEHARLSIKADKTTAYMIYCLLRANVQKQNASSHYTKNEIKSLFIDLGFSPRKWTRIFQDGNGIFWNMEYHRLYMRSYDKVTRNLERFTVDKIDYKSRFLRQIELEYNLGDNNALLSAKLYFAWFLARGEVTIARDTITDLFGLSSDQQRHYESLLSDNLLIKHNYAHIDFEDYQARPRQLPQHHYTFGYERLTEANKLQKRQAIQYQLPNTFIASNGQKPTTRATKSLIKACLRRSWHTDSYEHNKALYMHTWRDFEKKGNEDCFVRAYSQGIKKLWLSSHYL